MAIFLIRNRKVNGNIMNKEKLTLIYRDINGNEHTASIEDCPIRTEDALVFTRAALRLAGYYIEPNEDEQIDGLEGL